MKVFNALKNESTYFTPNPAEPIKIYACGPTVYDHLHIGNARPLILVDLFCRYWKIKEQPVIFLQNITDVDDKIIFRANQGSLSEKTVALKYTHAFYENLEQLNCLAPTYLECISDYMTEQIAFIEALMAQNYAYVSEGNVYFAIKNFIDPQQSLAYGQLSHRPIEKMINFRRIAEDINKKNNIDFALWKKTTVGITWSSSWGAGRPGWHTECATLNNRFFKGQTIDFHFGGIDLKFPHHENERIQYIALNKRELAHIWVYNGHVNVSQSKMSKSLGNFMTIRRFLDNNSPNVLRILFYNSKYRQPLNLNESQINNALTENRQNLHLLQKIATYCQNENVTMHQLMETETSYSYLDLACATFANDLNSANIMTIVHDLRKKLVKQLQLNQPLALDLVKEYWLILTHLLGFVFDIAFFTKYDDPFNASLFQMNQKAKAVV